MIVMQPASKGNNAHPSTSSRKIGVIEGGNLAMLLCGCIVLLMTLPMIFLNERKMARIYNVLARGKEECIPLVPIRAAE